MNPPKNDVDSGWGHMIAELIGNSGWGNMGQRPEVGSGLICSTIDHMRIGRSNFELVSVAQSTEFNKNSFGYHQN